MLSVNRQQSIAAALEWFREATRRIDRDKKLRPLARRFERLVSGRFQEQGRLFLRNMSQLEYRFQESVGASDWLPLLFSAQMLADMTDDFADMILAALLLGGGDLLRGLGIEDDDDFGITWNLENPRAVEYARQHAAAQVRRINDTTRDYLNSLITRAVEEGWSYDRLSAAIDGRFAEFAGGRSRRIAVFELGDAYEAGQDVMVGELKAAGLEMEQKWLTARDSKVRPSHRENEAAGWIDVEKQFPSGDSRPPTDPGCRCTRQIRRKRR